MVVLRLMTSVSERLWRTEPPSSAVPRAASTTNEAALGMPVAAPRIAAAGRLSVIVSGATMSYSGT